MTGPAQDTTAAAAEGATDELRKAMGDAATPTPPVHVPRPTDRGAGVLGQRLTQEQIALIKSTMMTKATDDEVAVFVHVCNRTGLDPFARQIHAIKRRSQVGGQWVEKYVHQVAIDGFRLIAIRTQQYNGRTEAEFYDGAGNARKVWLSKEPPRACRVGVMRKGIAEPFFVTVLWDEYVATTKEGNPTMTWREKATVMLAKVAEAAALRAAFPQELSGLYTDDEMAHADEPADEPSPIARTSPRAAPADERAAELLEDGDVMLRFGTFMNRRVSSLTLEEATKLVAGWNDPQRRASAEDRLGVGAVNYIAEHYRRMKAGEKPAEVKAPTAPEPEPQPEGPRIPSWVARAIEAKAAGQVISEATQDDLRQWLAFDASPEARAAVEARLAPPTEAAQP